jgi:hypothetical protein
LKILTEKLEKNSKNQLSVLMLLGNTQWSSHFDAYNVLIKNYNTIIMYWNSFVIVILKMVILEEI